MSTLLVLGGGSASESVLGYAREAGLRGVLLDPDPRTSARRRASEFHSLPWNDERALLGFVRGALAREHEIAGVLAATEPALRLLGGLAEFLPQALAPRAVLERLATAERAREALRAAGFDCGDTLDAPAFELFAFFRDGALVPGGSARRLHAGEGDELCLQPSGLGAAELAGAYRSLERAAQALGLTRGFVQATLRKTEGGWSFARLVPGVLDLLGASEVARLAYGKSPLQAWCAQLCSAGGPFDEPLLASEHHAGWLRLQTTRGERFAGLDGAARARALPGIRALTIDESSDAPLERGTRTLAHIVAVALDECELEQRLRTARAALAPRFAVQQQLEQQEVA
jgi:hypothetical protein